MACLFAYAQELIFHGKWFSHFLKQSKTTTNEETRSLELLSLAQIFEFGNIQILLCCLLLFLSFEFLVRLLILKGKEMPLSPG